MTPPDPPLGGDDPSRTNPGLRRAPEIRRMLLAPLAGGPASSLTYEMDVLDSSGKVGLSVSVARLTDGGSEPVTAKDPDLRIGRELSDVDSSASKPGQPRRWRVVDVRIERAMTVFDLMGLGEPR